MLVKQLMSKKLITARPDASLEEITKLIFDKRISGLPIVDKNKELLGIIAEEDILEKLYPSYESFFFDPALSRNFEKMEENVSELTYLKAQDIMNKKVFTTTQGAPIMKAASTMLIHKVNCLPVVKERNERKILIGIICKGDIFSHLLKTTKKKKKKS